MDVNGEFVNLATSHKFITQGGDLSGKCLQTWEVSSSWQGRAALLPRLAGRSGEDTYGSLGFLVPWAAGTAVLLDACVGLTCPLLEAKATQEPLQRLNEPPLSFKECDQRV